MQLLFRPQSIYLLLGAICAGLMFLFPISTYAVSQEAVSEVFKLDLYGLILASADPISEPIALQIPLHILVPLVGAFLLISMFLFKNRKRQLLVTRSTFFVTLLILVGAYMGHHSAQASLAETWTEVSTAFGVAFYLPFAILAFIFLATRRIKKDEDLVRSLDRLR